MARFLFTVVAAILPLAACVNAPPPASLAPGLPPPPVAAPRIFPDLALEPAGCKGGEIAFRVLNAGGTYAAPFRIVTRNRLGDPLKEWRVEGLADGDAREFRFAAMPGLVYTVVVDPDVASEDADSSNNMLRATCGGGSSQADLAVASGRCVGDRIFVQVLNQGAAAGPFEVTLRDPQGRLAANWPVPGLSHGAVTSFTHVRQQSGTFQLLIDPADAARDGDRTNNGSRIVCGNDGGGRQADLSIDGTSCRNGMLTATIRNVGQAPAGGFAVGLRATGERRIADRRPVAILQPGGTATVSFGPLAGSRFEVEADVDNAVPDVYRGNNTGRAICEGRR